MEPNSSAMMLGMFTIFLFLLNAIKNKHHQNIKDFLFSSQSISSNKFSSTTVASGTSLSTVFIFFIITAPIYGWWLLFAPMTYAFGLLISNTVFKKVSLNTNLNEIGSISDFISKKTNFQLLVYVTEIITFFGFLAIILVEVILGLQILNHFINDNVNIKTIFIIIILSITALYVYLGGYKAVIDSDSWQNKLILSSVGGFFVYLILIFSSNPDKISSIFTITNIPITLLELIVFLLNVLILNIFLPISQLSMWHRFSISKSKDDVSFGINKSIKVVFILWGLLIFIGISIYSLGYKLENVEDVFNMLIKTSSIGAYIIFPLIFIGMLSALLSTVDTSLITIIYLLFNSKKTHTLFDNKISIFLSIFFTLILVIILYFLVNYTVGIDLLSIIFTILGQIVLLGPPLVMLSNRNINLSIIESKILAIGLVVSIVLLWTISFYGMHVSKLWISQLGIPVSVLFMTLISLLLWKNK
ncbi:hypothetical protein [uncultured Arcobacter sp.]|uniref:hypothetical protein n=1 Tax=uncultured Arcobacter sp. TaxID=165434 RepID=UPI002621374B|nr:hypothetical protein [uncultured Arcobacter sp.]